MNPNCPINDQYVIPAKAEIQLIGKFPRSGSTIRFCPLHDVFLLLDFRLRGNDGTMDNLR